MCKGRSPQSAVSRDKMRSSLKSLEIYKDAVVIGEVVWDHVAGWNHLAQDTIGKQMIQSADSIAVSLAEGYGHNHERENLKFCYHCRGSLVETQTWLEVAAHHRLTDSEQARQLYRDLETLRKRLNAYIKTIGPQSPPHDS